MEDVAVFEIDIKDLHDLTDTSDDNATCRKLLLFSKIINVYLTLMVIDNCFWQYTSSCFKYNFKHFNFVQYCYLLS